MAASERQSSKSDQDGRGSESRGNQDRNNNEGRGSQERDNGARTAETAMDAANSAIPRAMPVQAALAASRMAKRLSHHEAAAHHHRQAAHHTEKGDQENARRHSARAHEQSTRANESSHRAHQDTHGRSQRGGISEQHAEAGRQSHL